MDAIDWVQFIEEVTDVCGRQLLHVRNNRPQPPTNKKTLEQLIAEEIQTKVVANNNGHKKPNPRTN